MSGIVGSKFNIRGSGLVGSLGTDGQHMLSAGPGKSNVFETAAGGGSWNLIKSLTASGDATLSFVNGTDDVVIDTTYNVYCFTFSFIHPQTLNASFQFNVSDDAGSNYDLEKTQHTYRAWNSEANSSGAPTDSTFKLANDTGVALLNQNVGNTAGDECCSGCFWLYNPGSTTFVKMYESQNLMYHSSDYIYAHVVTGYVNDTAAVDAVQFSFSSGNIDAGVISLYGITK